MTYRTEPGWKTGRPKGAPDLQNGEAERLELGGVEQVRSSRGFTVDFGDGRVGRVIEVRLGLLSGSPRSLLVELADLPGQRVEIPIVDVDSVVAETRRVVLHYPPIIGLAGQGRNLALPPVDEAGERNLKEAVERATPRHVEPEDWLRFRESIAEILTALGMEVDGPATARTPERFLQALFDATAGYDGDHKLLTSFPTECSCDADCLVSQIIEGPISFHALCEHHALPFHGVAHVGYVSHERIIGLSKLTRLVRLFARRFTLQERLGEQIADAFAELLEPHGVAVHLEAVHLCTQMRGVREEHSKTVTSVWRGAYSDNPELRREFLAEISRGTLFT
jgi:GTP cyclohydrolase I